VDRPSRGKLEPKTKGIIAKKHPLEDKAPEIANVRFVDSDTHVMDLIDLAAIVVVINSGVGLIALSCGKRVICCGQSYYSHPGLAVAVSSPDELVEAVKGGTPPDNEKRLRFFRYLIEEFYSFGSASYVTKTSPTGEKTRPVTRILFSSLRGLTPTPVHLGEPAAPVPLRAPLYFSFGGRDAIQERTNSVQWLLKKSKGAQAEGNIAEAIRLMEIAHQRAPNDKGLRSAVLDAAKTARENKNYAAAIALLEVAHRWAPDDGKIHRLLLEAGVERYGGPLVNVMVSSVSRLREQARQDFARGDYAAATRLFDILHLREPDKIEHLRCLAECYVQTGAKGLALKCLDEALRLSPGHKMIVRRKNNIRLPRWLQPLFPGKAFPVRR